MTTDQSATIEKQLGVTPMERALLDQVTELETDFAQCEERFLEEIARLRAELMQQQKAVSDLSSKVDRLLALASPPSSNA